MRLGKNQKCWCSYFPKLGSILFFKFKKDSAKSWQGFLLEKSSLNNYKKG